MELAQGTAMSAGTINRQASTGHPAAASTAAQGTSSDTEAKSLPMSASHTPIATANGYAHADSGSPSQKAPKAHPANGEHVTLVMADNEPVLPHPHPIESALHEQYADRQDSSAAAHMATQRSTAMGQGAHTSAQKQAVGRGEETAGSSGSSDSGDRDMLLSEAEGRSDAKLAGEKRQDAFDAGPNDGR